MSKTNLQQQVTVQALPSKVWRVLTCSDYVNQYLVDGRIISAWTEGSPILLDGEQEDSNAPVTIGRVFQSIPGMFLKFSLREENDGTFIVTTYELIVARDGIDLKLKREGFSATYQEWMIRVQQANLVLQKIKWLAEYS